MDEYRISLSEFGLSCNWSPNLSGDWTWPLIRRIGLCHDGIIEYNRNVEIAYRDDNCRAEGELQEVER